MLPSRSLSNTDHNRHTSFLMKLCPHGRAFCLSLHCSSILEQFAESDGVWQGRTRAAWLVDVWCRTGRETRFVKECLFQKGQTKESEQPVTEERVEEPDRERLGRGGG